MKKLLPLLVAVLLLPWACRKQDSPVFTGAESGQMKGGVFTNDTGVSMTIDGNEEGYDIRTPRRVLATYRMHPLRNPGGVVIDVVFEPDPAGALPEEAAGRPVLVTDAWFSGGYLNILAGAADGEHGFSAAYSVEARGIILRLLDEGSPRQTDRETALGLFLSIPMAGALQAYDLLLASLGQDIGTAVPVFFQWTGYRQDGEQTADEPVLFQKEGTFRPSS